MFKNNKILFYVKKGEQKLHATQHLFAAQMARECMIDAGEGDASMQIVDSNGRIYPNAGESCHLPTGKSTKRFVGRSKP